MKTTLTWILLLLIPSVQAQPQPGLPPAGLVLTAKGTGQTTGHIANISVTNKNDFPVSVLEQVFYIPSDGKYQSYVGRIPDDFIISPGGSEDIPVMGVCTDVTTPPVPSGTSMPPIGDWIPVDDPSAPPGSTPGDPAGGSTSPDGNPVLIVWNNPVPRFDPGDIPVITGTRGFTPVKDPPGDIIVTWPGTDIPVGGTLDPREDPKSFAPVVVDAWVRIEDAAEVIQQSDFFGTPFSGDPEKERESIIQQTVWIFTAHITGDDYGKDDFAGKVYEQFEDNAGKTVSSLPAEQKEKLEDGIDDFWNVFTAVGVEAKVIDVKSPGVGKADSKDDGKPKGTTTEGKKKGECSCESMTFSVNTDFGGLSQNVKDVTITKFGSGGSESILIERSETDYPNEVKITLSDIKMKCNPCGEIPCEPYGREKGGTQDKMEPDRKNKVKISKPEMTSAYGKKIGEEKIGDNSVEITTKPSDPKKYSNYFISFTIDATCMATDCTKDWCYRNITIEVRQLTHAEKLKREAAAEAEKKKAEKAAEKEKKKAEKAAKKVKKE